MKGSSKKAKNSSNVKKKLQVKERLLKEYGGDINKGTEKRINDAISSLPSHVQQALDLHRKIARWNAYVSSLSVLNQSRISQQELDGAKRAQNELNQLYSSHDLSDVDIHNILQKTTWDASADAKAAKAIFGNMPSHIEERVDRACDVIATAVRSSGRRKGRCLDIGCGYGALVPHLTKFGVLPSQIVGVDLSTEMIRNAKEKYRGVDFIAADFLNEYEDKDEKGFDGIIFCSSFHDLPEPNSVIAKAVMLLRPGGKLVIVHAQGSDHVLSQHRANPILVKRGLPTAKDWRELKETKIYPELEIEHLSADPGTPDDKSEGYLVILKKIEGN
eukprot:CAMPEP_0184864336 /NCGR_PEP_ID=MMETSP0580-20130426/14554_1 /TAXON_ID=1118495 /ORGANISM="Dactyliosolen fragilissimus" /LENGTH=330 /DNA_ID=CAMNT_0027363067 /DNA_START=183 /DNA_END=1175 /DNA_ORIENTATION=-